MHSRQNIFCKFSFLEQKSESKKKKKILLLACDYDFAKANETHPIEALIAPTTWVFWLVSLLILFSTFPNSFNIPDLKIKYEKSQQFTVKSQQIHR